MSAAKSIFRGAMVISFFGLLSRVFGLVRDRILAGQFGSGDFLDIYYAGFRIPDLFLNLIGLGVLSAAFIPVVAGFIKKEDGKKFDDNREAWVLTNKIFNAFLSIFFVGSALLIIFAPWIVPLITPGFSDEKMRLTIRVSQIMFLSPMFLGASNVFGGALQSFRRFLAFSAAPIFYNLGIILGALLFVKWWGIYGLAAGVVVGAGAHSFLQWIACRKIGYRYQPIFRFRDNDLIKVIKLLVPRVLGAATSQINLLVITIISSTLAVGSLTIFNLANNIQYLAIGLVAMPLALALFPVLAKMGADKNFGEFNSQLSRSLRQIIFLMLPTTVLLVVLRLPIVELILGTGKFGAAAINGTAAVLAAFAISLFAQAMIPVLARAFYSLQNTAVPFFIGLAAAALNIVLGYFLSKSFGISGLVVAFSISNIFNVVLLWVLLK
ncbi:murein biosynthesis integral membrane protein MurJ, partial [Candidatus Falkowbacteria bacterium]|nr:murein biosynthesis integral membrane protein MurJ [Candidatus Falkowbacteria bacterium]